MKRLKSQIAMFLVPLLATCAFAQIGDWRAVEALPGGTRIHVTLIHGRTFNHCVLAGVDDNQLSCDYPGPFWMQRRAVYPRANIRGVYRVHNGALIGLGVGAVAGAAMGAATYSKSNDPNFGRVGTPIVTAGLLGGLGMAIGGILNPFFHGKAVYRSATPAPQPVSPNDPQTESKTSSASTEEEAGPPAQKIPCLRGGTTLQCVE